MSMVLEFSLDYCAQAIIVEDNPNALLIRSFDLFGTIALLIGV